MSSNDNLFVALRDAFPADLDATAIETIETAAGAGNGFYTWRDIERTGSRIAKRNKLEAVWNDHRRAARLLVQRKLGQYINSIALPVDLRFEQCQKQV